MAWVPGDSRGGGRPLGQGSHGRLWTQGPEEDTAAATQAADPVSTAGVGGGGRGVTAPELSVSVGLGHRDAACARHLPVTLVTCATTLISPSGNTRNLHNNADVTLR